ncbi:MAG TPA: CdaR family protein [Verrucomicrobiota bacterium]|nr:CdaR family protein [Verrucomicrobiota bacterium]
MRELITKDIGWKIFSLALAVIIWLTVRTVSQEAPRETGVLGDWQTRTFTQVPVLVISAAAEVREFEIVPQTVDLEVSGRPDIMASLQPRDIQPVIDLTEIEYARSLRKRVTVSAPPGVTLVWVKPAEVNVGVPLKQIREE